MKEYPRLQETLADVLKRSSNHVDDEGSRLLTEDIVREIMTDYGIKFPPHALVTNIEECTQKVSELGLPLAAKIVSDHIVHKTEVHGVKTQLRTTDEVLEAFSDLHDRLSQRFPIKGVLLEKMSSPGLELIVGLQNDPTFGPIIMLGLGGVYTEILNDVSFRVLPISKHDALEMVESLKGNKILKGYRGSAPVNLDMLTELIVNIGSLGMKLAPFVESIDFNPIILYQNDYRAVDVKVLLKERLDDINVSDAQPDSNFMDIFFKPKSVAVIGASPEASKVGNSILKSLLERNFCGKVFPISYEGHKEVMGLRAFKCLEDVDEQLDLVVVTVDLKLVPDLVKSCGKKDIHNMIIFTGGGKELGGERAGIEQEIRKLARQLKVRIIGPNCIGLYNSENYLDCVFRGDQTRETPLKGQVAFVSQSGTIGAAFMDSCSRSFGLSKMVSYGNRVDVDEADILWYLSNDPNTSVIGMYFEGLGDGRKFLNTAKKVIAEKKKPIIVFKNNRSERAAKQSALHNGSLATSYAVMSGALTQADIVSVDSYEELIGSLKAFAWQPTAKGNKVAMVTNGGGAVVAALDRIDKVGLQTADITAETKRALEEHYPPTYIAANPCDLTCIATADDYRFAIEKFMEDPNVNIIMLWFVPWFVFKNDPLNESIVEILARFQRESEKPILVGTMEGAFDEPILRSIEEQNVPVYRSVSTWVNAAASLNGWFKTRYVKKVCSVMEQIDTFSSNTQDIPNNPLTSQLLLEADNTKGNG
ncbi:MAG: acetate--CoA ligase family protein [Thermoproteota archaeon]|nr:acetate--CoA ligase family protein [Thermoproteota archaeon]